MSGIRKRDFAYVERGPHKGVEGRVDALGDFHALVQVLTVPPSGGVRARSGDLIEVPPAYLSKIKFHKSLGNMIDHINRFRD